MDVNKKILITIIALVGIVFAVALTVSVVRANGMADLPFNSGVGPDPELPKPDHSVFPAIDTVKAVGWGANETPVAAEDLQVNAFATGFDHPRWVYVLPNGDVLVAETNAPPKPEDGKGIKGWVYKQVQARAGAGVPSANRITLLRDADGDGVAEVRSTFLTGLHSPFGMTLVGNTLYIADTDAVVSVPYTEGQTEIKDTPTKLVDLPAGPINHHWTKNVVANPEGTKLYVSVGSNSNAAENGIDKEEGRAAIWEVDIQTGEHRIFASGLRNPVGMAWTPDAGELWVVVNERDELGSDLVPDYLTSVQDGGFYGWPYSYYGDHVDSRVEPQRPDLVAQAIVPDYAIGNHVAPLGLTYSGQNALPSSYQNGMFIGEHGSWNRIPRSGYSVVFIPFNGGKPGGSPLVVLSGFIRENGDAMGRPVGVAIDAQGALLVADDVGNTVWRVTSK